MRVLLGVMIVCGWLGACSPPTTDGTVDAGCADSLSVTGWCPSQVAEAVDPARATDGVALEGPAAQCSWTMQDVGIGDGGEAVVYRAMTCNGVTTAFEYAGGAHSASLNYRTSALGHPSGAEAVRIFTADAANSRQALESLIAALPAAERARCEVQPANIAGWPSDALVIGYNAAAARTLPTDQPNAVCGDYGRDDNAAKFWLIRDGYAFFFNLGQDGVDFEPNSFTVFRRNPEGVWGPASSSP